ncbi:MFS transporter [Levilactobacillus zymae]|uniref:MFS transporter n=1 Tax=Levilactobacillus zymae TaxID=267363 RepID=UPI0028BCB411|nr:MFS transporter [Levilactobacillus zymae]MDT6979285.1 MFS transporter [Levilactobacillus zymae]
MNITQLIRKTWPLLLLGFLVNTAYSVMWPLTTIYLHDDLKLNLVTSGWILVAYSGCNVLGGYLGGILGDRYSLKRVGLLTLVGLIVDSAAGFFWNGLIGYPIVLVIFGLLTGAMLTLVTTMTAQLSHVDSRLFNLLYIFINLGLVAGTASIGILFKHSLQPIFLMLLGCYVLALVVWTWSVGRFMAQASHPQAKVAQTGRPQRTMALVTLGLLLLSLVLMWGTYSQWMSNVSVYVQEIGLSIKVYSYLWVYNGLLLILVQSVMTKFSHNKVLPWQILGGLLAICGSFLLLSTAKQIGMLFVAMTLLTVGEAVYVPGVPALINAYTVGNEGRYQGLVNSFSSIGKALGPVFGGWIVGGSLGFSGLFMVCAAINGVVVLGVLGGLLPYMTTRRKNSGQ